MYIGFKPLNRIVISTLFHIWMEEYEFAPKKQGADCVANLEKKMGT